MAVSSIGDGRRQRQPGRRGAANRPRPTVRIESQVIHGYRRVYRIAGAGPPVLLIHGIGDSSATWRTVLPQLARRHLVIAPDLLGHGASAKPRADYSTAAYANGMRDLLGVLGIDRVTLVGHSLGGGVAMQFAYQFPERTERMVLVSSGGAGRHVSPLLRTASLPGAQAALAALRLPGARSAVNAAIWLLERFDTGLGLDAPDLRRVVEALPDATARAAFIRTLRSVVDWRGQVVTMLDRCYLVRGMPTLLIWGDRDSVLPIGHAYQAYAAMPGSRLEVFEGAGHFPFRSDPNRFVDVLEDFLASTQPSEWGVEQWRELLRAGRPAAVQHTESPRFAETLRAASERSAT
ncbi:alpha/beta fold hydrolase [uncultured Jatrophihabitans sp.]|uniref:alpha/beta fold hydrolase n=1 Tax=uncultured Jatrophihabitans sp. TaxID=1610747 RepID=UPI0035CB9726